MEHSYSPRPGEHTHISHSASKTSDNSKGSTEETVSDLEPAEWVLLVKFYRGVVVAEEAFACAPVSLQLVPLGQDGVTFVS